MAKKEAVFIVGAIAVGAAVARSLFLLYPDLAFRNTGFDSQSSAATDVPSLWLLTTQPWRQALAQTAQAQPQAQILRCPSQAEPVRGDHA